MKITYTGKDRDFTQEQQKKLDNRFARLGKLVERNGERKAHVVLKSTRHLNTAEITMNLQDHPLISMGSNGDVFSALTEAATKLEKQILKVLEKKREPRRDGQAKLAKQNGGIVAVAAAASEDEAEAVRVYRVNSARQKPMTLEEAMMQIGDSKDYLIYRDMDAEQAISVLIRRKDGHFDLVQA
jgi:putative sigma-54 modulation protein